MPARSCAIVVTSLLTAALLLSGCAEVDAGTGADGPDEIRLAAQVSSQTTSARSVAGVQGRRVEVVAVGDIACVPGAPVTATTCRHAAVASLTKRIDPKAVLALGDLQYETGSLHAFRNSYANSWGELKPITYPTPGNHEYRTEGAQGYFDYFSGRTPESPGYYAFDLGRWRAYSVNGNCSEIDCDRQVRWLKRQLDTNEARCSVIATHFPRYSTGEHGDSTFMRRFFRVAFRHRVDVMLTGHDHHYERFKRMNHKGELRRRGVVQFVSGAGGKSHHGADGDAPASAYVEDDTFGVLRLVLRPKSFQFAFRGIDGSRQDAGTRDCV